MPNMDEIMLALSGKKDPVSAADIVPEVKSTTQVVTALFRKLKGKDLAEGDGTRWVITNNGRERPP